MRYLSLFSGIEAASAAWGDLGWECAAVAEVEPFPCAVLAYHYPDVPNLGDVTKITEADVRALGHIDVVVGGSPCQSFSVAGLRQGLADPRGNLLLEFLRIVDLARPRFVVWENVPGVLADKTSAFDVLLDALGELGYSIDAQVLDAQEFGVAQRRKRVFLVCERRDDGGNERPRLSARSTLEQIGKLSLLALAELSAPYRKWQKGSVLHGVSMSGLQKKMRLFGAPSNVLETRSTWIDFWSPYLNNLGSGSGLSTFASNTSDLPSATHPEFATLTEMGGPGGAKKDAGLWSIGSLLRAHLDVVWSVQNASTTSTLTSGTTPPLTYLFAVTVANIATCISSLSNSPDSLFSEDSLFLTAIEEFTKYATSRDVKRVIADGYAALMCDDAAYPSPGAVARSLGDWAGRPPILLEPESLRGDTPPRREAGQSITHPIAPCIGASGRGFERGGDTRGQDAVVAQPFTVANTLTQRMSKGINSTVDEGQTPVVSIAHAETMPTMQTGSGNPSGHGARSGDTKDAYIVPVVTHSLRGEGFDASEDGTGRGTPLVPVLPFDTTQVTSPQNRSAPRYGDPCHPLQSTAHVPAIAYSIITANTGANGLGVTQELSATLDQAQPHAIAYAIFGGNPRKDRPEGGFYVRRQEVSKALDAAGGLNPACSQGGMAVATSMQVRRLTPTECERLQGFPDGHTGILYRNKPAADGPRYKALGNSMAVPVMRHIGIKIMEAVWN